jgi:hypothetical protein
MVDMGELEFIVGLRLRREGNRSLMSQELYVQDVLTRMKMQHENSKKTPFVAGTILHPREDGESKVEQTNYRSIVGSLAWGAIATRPFDSFYVNQLCRHLHDPSEEHLENALNMLRYWKYTMNEGIQYMYEGEDTKEARRTYICSGGLIAQTDAEWAGDESDSKSTCGRILTLGGGPIVWGSGKSSTVAKSSTAAEIDAADAGMDEIYWARDMLAFLGFSQTLPTVLKIDNENAILNIKNGNTTKRNKYYRVRVDSLHDAYEEGIMKPEHEYGKNLSVDGLTKSLVSPMIKKHKASCGIRTVSEFECYGERKKGGVEIGGLN